MKPNSKDKKVRSYEHACKVLGIIPNLNKPNKRVVDPVKSTLEHIVFVDYHDKKLDAMIELKTIVAAYNSLYEGEEKFPRYYPVFTRNDVGDAKVLDYVNDWDSYTDVPAPFLFFNMEDCEEAVETFADLFKEVYSYN